jgi:GAF domain-containing protein/HAMP domain-containing protein
MPNTEPTSSHTTLPRLLEDSSETRQAKLSSQQATYSRLLILLGVFSSVTGGFYLVMFFITGIVQALWASIFMLFSLVLIPLIHSFARKGSFRQAGILTLFGVSMAYGFNELIWSGLTPYHLAGGVLLILLTGSMVLPGERQVWVSAIGGYIIYIFLAYSVQPLPRYSVSDIPVLLPYAIGTIVLLILVLAILAIQSMRTRTIRTRLLINFIILVLTPVILSSIISSILSSRNAQARAYSQLESVATLKENEIAAWINNLKTSLIQALPATERTWIFATSLDIPVVKSDDVQLSPAAGYIESDFKKFVDQTELFEALFLLNSKGDIFISSHKNLLNLNQASEPYFIEGLKNTYLTSLSETPLLNKANGSASDGNPFTILLSTPVVNADGEVLGVLAGQASLKKLSEIMSERAGLGKTGETYMISPKLELITESRFSGFVTGEKYRFDDILQQAINERKSGKATYRGYRGITVLGVYRWQPNFPLLLIAENEQSEALMSTYQTLGLNLGVAAIAAMLAVGAGWYAARGITDQLSKLSKTAKAIAAGKLTLKAEVEQDDEVGELAKSFNSMTDQMHLILDGLERRVTERTRDAERHSLQLQVASEVARDATSTRDLMELLHRAVTLVSENFRFYHAGIFLIDERGEYAVLRAATGQAGQQMLRDGHKLAVGQSEDKRLQGLVGYVSWSGEARVASNVGADAIHFKNPLLPKTRAEVALPLKVGTQVIGVLDVQSVDEGAFDEENVRILQTLADQLAVAIENARLFQEMNQTVRELETVYGQYTREAWINLKSGAGSRGGDPITDYRYRGLAIETAQEPNIEATEALESGQTIIKEGDAQSALAIPLRLRGETVGVVNLRFGNSELPTDAVSTYEEIADRLVLVLENARLLQEAQKIAKREQQINVITTQIRSSPTTESILRNTVREIGNALGTSRTFIQLGIQTGDGGNGKDQTPPSDMAANNGDQEEHR